MNKDVGYYISKPLKKKWDKIRAGVLAENDEDRVYVVDGREGSGKSVFTLQQAYYIDPTIIIPEEAKKRIVFTAENFLKAIRETQSNKDETKVIIFDEAFRGLSSRSMMSRTNKAIIQALMEMRQKNLVVFIVLPTFFMLDLYPAMLRSNALFNIQKSKKNPKMRYFRVFNYAKKALLYQTGVRKGWQYKIYTPHKDYFFNKYPGGDEFEKLYRQMKLDSLESMPKAQETPQEAYQSNMKERNKRYIEGAKDYTTFTEYHKALKEDGDPISLRQLTRIVPKEALMPRKTPPLAISH